MWWKLIRRGSEMAKNWPRVVIRALRKVDAGDLVDVEILNTLEADGLIEIIVYSVLTEKGEEALNEEHG